MKLELFDKFLNLQVMVFPHLCWRTRPFLTFSVLITISLISQVFIFHVLMAMMSDNRIRCLSETAEEESIVLLRAIGNDIVPYHQPNQALNILKFILKNEHEYPNLKKHFVLNRIVKKATLDTMVKLLEKHQQNYTIIPFNLTEYQKVPLRFDDIPDYVDIIHDMKFWINATELERRNALDSVLDRKNIYITNANSVRNKMLDIGSRDFGADWILPWDGNCFLTPSAWKNIKQAIDSHGLLFNYFVTPTDHVQVSDEKLLDSTFGLASDSGEPQIIFHKSAEVKFNRRIRYGKGDKADLLKRFGILGEWDDDENISTPIPDIQSNRSGADGIRFMGQLPIAGWVPQLVIDVPEKNYTQRRLSRSQGIEDLVDELNLEAAVKLNKYSPLKLIYYDEEVLKIEKRMFQNKSAQGENAKLIQLINKLISVADNGLQVGPWSVTEKAKYGYLPPSNNSKDYYHPSPYHWPNPDTPNGLPFVKQDGIRVPGTEMYGEHSERYDRSRLAAMQFNTTVLTLAWYFTDNMTYAEKAAENLRVWFLDSKTSMTPHLKYSQIIWGLNNNLGTSAGIIEMKDVVFMLDAVRLLYKAKIMINTEYKSMVLWFKEYYKYISTSLQGRVERNHKNNHGLYYDIHYASVASFINSTKAFLRLVNYGPSRQYSQITVNGAMPLEMDRPICEHYQMFTQMGWNTFHRIASKVGLNYWQFEDTRLTTYESQVESRHPRPEHQKETALCRASMFSIPYLRLRKKCNSILQDEDKERWLPLWHSAIHECPYLRNSTSVKVLQKNEPDNGPGFERMPLIPNHHYEMRPLYHEHDGVPPFWNLGYMILPES